MKSMGVVDPAKSPKLYGFVCDDVHVSPSPFELSKLANSTRVIIPVVAEEGTEIILGA